MQHESVVVRNGKWALSYEGRVLPLNTWADEYGLTRSTLYSRLKAGWDVERALNTPIMGKGG